MREVFTFLGSSRKVILLPGGNLFPGLAHTQVLPWGMDKVSLSKGAVPESHQSLVRAAEMPCTEGSEVFHGGADTQWNTAQAFRHIMLSGGFWDLILVSFVRFPGIWRSSECSWSG